MVEMLCNNVHSVISSIVLVMEITIMGIFTTKESPNTTNQSFIHCFFILLKIEI